MLSVSLFGQAQVSVRATSTLNEVSELPLGLNLNSLVDNDANRVDGARPLRTALAATGARYLRFPGGEKSDAYAWAAPPYNDPSTAYLLRQSERDWPANDPRFWDLGAGKWATSNYNFDQFMADCQATGAEPVVVVAFDGMYLPAHSGGTALSREQALEMAVAWVRYANVTKGYNVKYWELGNETWNGTTYAGRDPGFTTYGRDVAEFARAMKAVDPSIKIGINGASFSDFDLALKECAAEVDFLDVHAYPAYGFRTYDQYLNTQLNPGGIVNVAQRAIDAVADPEVREKLFIVMTETSATGYQLDSEWDAGNNLGQALANFDILMQMLEDSRVRFTQFWNSRWIRPDTGNSHPYDLFTATNELNASGQAMAMMADELLDRMVETTSEGVVRTFATTNKAGDQLTVFLLNKDTLSTPANLTLEGFTAAPGVARSVFTGPHPGSPRVEWKPAEDASLQNGQVALTLPPASVTILKFTPPTKVAAAPSGDYWLEAECATVGSQWITGESTGASGGQYTVVPRGSSMRVPPADLDENRVRFDLSVETAGTYHLFARINAPSNTKDSYWVRVNEGSWYRWNSGIIQRKGFQWNQLPDGVALRAGNNTIDFAFRESGTELDKLFVTRSGTLPTDFGADAGNCIGSSSSNSSTSGSVGTVEAECTTGSSSWDQQFSSEASGGSYLVFTGDRHLEEPAAGEMVQEFRHEIYVPETAPHYLFMRVDAPDPSRNSVWVKVDDQPWMKFWRETSGEQLLTNGFEWRMVNHDGVAGTLNLNAGYHTVRVANREPGTRIDKVTFSTAKTAPEGYGPDAADCGATTSHTMASSMQMQAAPTDLPSDSAPDSPVMSVFPNPADDQLTLEVTSDYNGTVNLIIYDLHGRSVQQEVFDKEGEQLQAYFPLDSFPSGVYLLRVVEGDHSTTQSFIRR
ncbi:alpha-L-arabinofuranosidase [Lewinella marina]|nr:T9SS type A sorting domain-containing protein [Neolewinella marina]NJB84597.1 alpha-L-arabinofuranosidase [Neolewinella marina]